MTSAVSSTSACPPEPALHRRFVACVSGGLDGAIRVAMMLRGRNYRVRDLTFNVRDGAALSEIRATVFLTPAEAELLVKRLQRIPAVVTAVEG